LVYLGIFDREAYRFVYFAIFDREAGEPRRGRLLPIRGIRSVGSGEVKKSSAQARKLRSLSNPVKAKAKLRYLIEASK
jgi:hypothetical protein